MSRHAVSRADSMERAEHGAKVRRLLVIEGLANSGILGLKLSVGLSTGSLAILADSLHSLTDVANNVIAWVVMRASAKPADRNHPYGHQKYEMIAVFVLAVMLATIGLEIAARGLRPAAEPPESTPVALAVMLGVLGANIAISAWQRYWAGRLQSAILMADASHTFADVLTTIVVIAGWQLSIRGYPWLDSACALAVAGMIFYLAYKLFRDALPVLVDEVAIEPEDLAASVRAVAGVIDVPRVRSRWIGAERAVDVIITVEAALTTVEAHTIADAVEARLERDFDVRDSTVHIEPDSRTAGDGRA